MGVDGRPEERDAAVLAARIARATGAELLLVTVHRDPPVVVSPRTDWAGVRKGCCGDAGRAAGRRGIVGGGRR